MGLTITLFIVAGFASHHAHGPAFWAALSFFVGCGACHQRDDSALVDARDCGGYMARGWDCHLLFTRPSEGIGIFLVATFFWPNRLWPVRHDAGGGDEPPPGAAPWLSFRSLDPVIHGKLRLAVLSLLTGVEEADFTWLREKTGSTDGNLGAQMLKLEEAGYVAMEKRFAGRKPQDALSHDGGWAGCSE